MPGVPDETERSARTACSTGTKKLAVLAEGFTDPRKATRSKTEYELVTEKATPVRIMSPAVKISKVRC